MSFWSSEKLKERLLAETLFEPCDLINIKNGAYELGLGSEGFVTSDGTQKKAEIGVGAQIVIPPGQFGLLITEERVTIPADAIGFISIKAGIKFRGLVNVSGFHVDPGFSGSLKFAVYNAGSQNIVLDRNQRVFLIWFSSLDRMTTDSYKGSHQDQFLITSEDVMRIQGDVASPAALKKSLETLRIDYTQDIAELRADYLNKITGIEKEVALWKSIATTSAIGLAVGIVLMVLTLFLGRISFPSTVPVSQQSIPSVAPAQPGPSSPVATPPTARPQQAVPLNRKSP